MRAIFISYRRDDSEGEAGRLFDDLVAAFGENSVFMDVAAIEPGRDFRKAIDDSVATCAVLLAMIGKGWVEAKNASGQRRLEDPSDFVRLETASALKRDIPVVPVLVRGATMPRSEQLPDDLKELSYRNGVELTHARWNSDLQLLIKALRPHVGDPKHPVGGQTDAPAGAATVRPPDPAPPEKKVPEVVVPPPPPRKKTLRTVLAVVAASVVALIIVGIAVAPKPTPGPGPQATMVEIPVLVGESLADARRTLADSHLQVGTIERKTNPGVTHDTVLQEFPLAGEKVSPGSKIDLMVSELPESPPGEDSKSASTSKGSTPSEKVPASSRSPKIPVDASNGAAASQSATTDTASESASQVAPPRDEGVNISGTWHDATGVIYQTIQRGNTFTYTAAGAGGTGRGNGTIRGLQFESAYTSFYVNGTRSTGRCSGMISADGSLIRATCFDSMVGQTVNLLSR